MVKGRLHIIMRQDDGVFLFFQLIDFKRQFSLYFQLKIRHDSGQLGFHPRQGFVRAGRVLY